MVVQISGQIISAPRQCICCGGTPDQEVTASAKRRSGKRVIRTQTRSWSFPYCTRCARHAQFWSRGQNTIVILSVVGVIVGYLFWSTLPIVAIAIGVVGIAVGWFLGNRWLRAARELCTPTCPSCTTTIHYLSWNGSAHTFAVDSDAYATALMQANRSKLVNVSPAALNLLQATMPKVSLPKATAAKQGTTRASVQDRLRKLDELRTSGLVTDQEYAEQRQRILDEL